MNILVYSKIDNLQ